MKKNLLTKSVLIASIFGLTITTGTASTNMDDLKFYAGVGFDYIKYSSNNASTNSSGISIPVLGIKFCDNFVLEAGYSFNKKLKMRNRSLKINNSYLDVIGFMPIVKQVDLIAGFGVGRLMVKNGANIPKNFKIKNKFNWRVKFGVQYNININFGVRGLFAYQNVQNTIKNHEKEHKFIKNMKSLGVSTIWTF